MRTLPLLVVSALAGSAMAAPVSNYTETFNAGDAAWANVASAPVTWNSFGGPDGSPYISTTGDLATADPQNGLLLFRCEDSLDSSGDAFVGDYLAGGVTAFSVDVRHDSTVPVSYYIRVAPVGGPGMLFLNFTPVAAGQWTTLTFDFSSSNPGWIAEGIPSQALFDSVASGIAKVQIGAIPTGASTQVATFDVDNFAIVPSPASAGLLGLGGLVATRRRR